MRRLFLLVLLVLIASQGYSQSFQGKWSTKSSEGFEKRTGHTATLTPDNKIYIIGGFGWDEDSSYNITNVYHENFQVYDIASDSWTTLPIDSTIHPHYNYHYSHSATLVDDSLIYILGGMCDFQGPHGTYIYDSTVHVLNIKTNEYRLLPTVNQYAPKVNAYTFLYNGKLYLFGDTPGSYSKGPISILDLKTNIWDNSFEDSSGGGWDRMPVLINNRLYVFGGRDSNYQLHDSSRLAILDLNTMSWNIPTPNELNYRDNFFRDAPAVYDDSLIILVSIGRVRFYNIKTNRFTTVSSGADFLPRSEYSVTTVLNTIYVIAGSSTNINQMFTLEAQSDVERIPGNNVGVFPNPTRDQFTVVGTNISSVTLLNSLGEIVYEGSTNIIPTTGLANGRYVLLVSSTGKYYAELVLVQK